MLVALLEALHERVDDVLVGARDELVHQLDDRHLGPELVVHRRHLQADDAAADNQHPLRQCLDRQSPSRVQHARVLVRDERQAHRLRPGGDDRLLEADHFAAAVGCLELQLVDRREAAVPLEYAHLALSGEAGQAAGKPRHHAVLPGAQLVQVDGRLDEVESAAFRHLAGL